MKRSTFITMILAASILAAALPGCDDSAGPEEDEDFILAVMVLDTGGQPLAGMKVGRLNSLEGILPVSLDPALPDDTGAPGPPYPNPFYGSTTVEYSVPDVSDVLLEVIDWRGVHVRKLMEGRMPAGNFSAIWDQREDGGEMVINGVYIFRLTMTDTLDVPEFQHAGISVCTVFDFRDPYRNEGMGLTDATGFFSVRDLDLFPSLQGHAPQDSYDGMKVHTGTFSFSDTVSIRVSTPPPPSGGWIYHMSREIVLVDGPNYLEFHFVPDDSTEVFGPLPERP